MVIPLGPMGGPDMMEEQEVPDRIKDVHSYFWWMLFVLFIGVAIGCVVALKIFDGLIAVMIGIWAYYMVKDNCKNMSQQCLFSFGLMCCIQAVMEFIILAMSLPGRRTQTTTTNGGAAQSASPHAAPSPFMGHGTNSYTVTVKTAPFFSEEEGWHYNLQSAMMIANCVIFIIAAILTRCSYGQYPNSLFEDRGESRPLGGSSFGGGSVYQSGGGGRSYSAGPTRPAQHNWGGGNRLGGSTNTFGGSGQRLGSA